MNGDEVLQDLLEGSERFKSGNSIHPRVDEARRRQVVKGQKPAACILTCSDSRTPPEILFDQGLGDLFVVRTAGNVADEAALLVGRDLRIDQSANGVEERQRLGRLLEEHDDIGIPARGSGVRRIPSRVG